MAVQQAREAAGLNTSAQTASNAPVREGQAVPSLVVSLLLRYAVCIHTYNQTVIARC